MCNYVYIYIYTYVYVYCINVYIQAPPMWTQKKNELPALSSKDPSLGVIAHLLPVLFGRRPTAIIQTPRLGRRIVGNVAVLTTSRPETPWIHGNPWICENRNPTFPSSFEWNSHEIRGNSTVKSPWNQSIVWDRFLATKLSASLQRVEVVAR